MESQKNPDVSSNTAIEEDATEPRKTGYETHFLIAVKDPITRATLPPSEEIVQELLRVSAMPYEVQPNNLIRLAKATGYDGVQNMFHLSKTFRDVAFVVLRQGEREQDQWRTRYLNGQSRTFFAGKGFEDKLHYRIRKIHKPRPQEERNLQAFSPFSSGWFEELRQRTELPFRRVNDHEARLDGHMWCQLEVDMRKLSELLDYDKYREFVVDVAQFDHRSRRLYHQGREQAWLEPDPEFYPKPREPAAEPARATDDIASDEAPEATQARDEALAPVA